MNKEDNKLYWYDKPIYCLSFRIDESNYVILHVLEESKKIVCVRAHYHNNGYQYDSYKSFERNEDVFEDLRNDSNFQDIILNDKLHNHILKDIKSYLCEEDYLIVSSILNNRIDYKINKLTLMKI